MNTIQTRLTAAAMISLACLVAGCNPAVKSTTVVIEVPAPIVQVEMLCPISGEPVTIDDEAAYIESFVVYCKGRENARQFASLDAKQRGKLGAAQVLPQKGIANTTCPLPSAAQAKQAASLQDVETELERLRVKAAAKVRPVGALPVASCLTRPSPAGPRVSVAALLRPAQAEDQYPGTRLQGPRLRVAQC
jgi:hypothetical protein